MMSFPVQTPETAPEGAKEILTTAKKNYGFVPNLLGVMSTAPSLVEGYLTLAKIFESTSFSPTERQVVLLATSYENECEYCMAVHSTFSEMQKVPREIVQAIRTGSPIQDLKLEALRRFTSAVVTAQGWASPDDVKAFFGAGYAEQQALEVVLGVGLKTISNYTTHIAKTPLDDAFSAAAWTKEA